MGEDQVEDELTAADVIERVSRERRAILMVAGSVKSLQAAVLNLQSSTVADAGEALANVMLAYRHLEDARMRLGKVIQALEGGVSVYDK